MESPDIKMELPVIKEEQGTLDMSREYVHIKEEISKAYDIPIKPEFVEPTDMAEQEELLVPSLDPLSFKSETKPCSTLLWSSLVTPCSVVLDRSEVDIFLREQQHRMGSTCSQVQPNSNISNRRQRYIFPAVPNEVSKGNNVSDNLNVSASKKTYQCLDCMTFFTHRSSLRRHKLRYANNGSTLKCHQLLLQKQKNKQKQKVCKKYPRIKVLRLGIPVGKNSSLFSMDISVGRYIAGTSRRAENSNSMKPLKVYTNKRKKQECTINNLTSVPTTHVENGILDQSIQKHSMEVETLDSSIEMTLESSVVATSIENFNGIIVGKINPESFVSHSSSSQSFDYIDNSIDSSASIENIDHDTNLENSVAHSVGPEHSVSIENSIKLEHDVSIENSIDSSMSIENMDHDTNLENSVAYSVGPEHSVSIENSIKLEHDVSIENSIDSSVSIENIDHDTNLENSVAHSVGPEHSVSIENSIKLEHDVSIENSIDSSVSIENIDHDTNLENSVAHSVGPEHSVSIVNSIKLEHDVSIENSNNVTSIHASPIEEIVLENSSDSDISVGTYDTSFPIENTFSFKCKKCPRTFYYESQLSGHNSRAHRDFNCKNCESKFCSQQKLNTHLCTHSVVKKSFKCNFCLQMFESKSILSTHITFQHEKEMVDELIKKSEKKKINTRISTRSIERKTFPTEYFKKRNDNIFKGRNNKSKIKRNNMKNSNEECDLNSIDEDVNRTETQTSKKIQVKCEFCTELFQRIDTLHAHIWQVHSIKSVSCRICDRKFRNNQVLLIHFESTHKRSKKYICDICKKIFYHKKYISFHLDRKHNINHKINTNLCKKCNKVFSSKQNLNRHIRIIHERQKVFNCEFCNKSFPENRNLIRHIDMVHESNKLKFNYYCKKCGKGYFQIHSLLEHEETYHYDIFNKKYV